MRFVFLFSLISFVLSYSLSGQSDNPEGDKAGNLYLELKSISFVKNKEYSNPMSPGLVYMGKIYSNNQLIYDPGYGFINPDIEGYTLIGNFIQPSLLFFPSSRFSIKVGAHLLNYSGTGRFSQFRPVVSSKYRFSDKTSLTLGSLDGCEKHRLYDPLFDQERMYNRNTENGIEFLTDQKHIFSDTWLDWEHFIFTGDTTREILTFGESFRYTSGKIKNLFDFNIPFQLLVRHKGGQISNYPENVETLINAAVGAGINFDLNGGNSGRVGFDYLHMIFYDNSTDQVFAVRNGYANWYKLHYNYKAFILELAYWKSHNFYTSDGNLIYSSISGYGKSSILFDRSLFNTSVFLTLYPVKDLELYLGFDFYYDLDAKVLYSGAALHLNFNDLFKLLSLKKK
jgi:hypothetical protein